MLTYWNTEPLEFEGFSVSLSGSRLLYWSRQAGTDRSIRGKDSF